MYTRPSKKAVADIKARVKTMTYRSSLHQDPGYLMEYLGRVLRGWANYFRHGVSKRVFGTIANEETPPSTSVKIVAWPRTASKPTKR